MIFVCSGENRNWFRLHSHNTGTARKRHKIVSDRPLVYTKTGNVCRHNNLLRGGGGDSPYAHMRRYVLTSICIVSGYLVREHPGEGGGGT